ncbi:hypothetical protein HNI00_11830 [Thermoleptolyngbya oregonensis NK1-22]|uniref:SPOR domain-containing protein n=1 Tax=Thermoleptolyngbya oregonensis NK1-22 TaxID=2547457 RepID=A0AA97BA39_9CYAN|nr:hypothetical protein [Thermoleptolyngbya oregonensis]WOB43765.1 hypothetical protein HNI00_11830 [Thermoleptolyngbya oregonensis NK1-22]
MTASFFSLWHRSDLRARRLAEGLPWVRLVLGAIALGSSVGIAVPVSAGPTEPRFTSSIAQPQRMAQRTVQRVVDGLPPPPDAGAGTFYPQPGAAVGSDGRGTSTAQFSGQQYVVIVNGNSPLLLSQVRQVAPGAGLQSYQGQQVIQAGVFGEEWTASQQVQALAAQGITAQVVAVSGGVAPVQTIYPDAAQASLDPLPPAPPVEVPFGQYPALEPQPAPAYDYGTADRSRGYYVLIPGSSGSLSRVSEQVRLLSEGFPVAGRVQERDRPHGPHVLVGPFSGRSAAERWNRYFRDFGLNARVHYER